MDAPAGSAPFCVVITGGPCAGKTEVWRFLGASLPQAVPVPEAATRLILAGRSEVTLGLERFQREVYKEQLALEEAALRKGPFLLCDRGLLDGLAYFPALLTCLGLSPGEMLSRYAMVIQLEVIPDPAAYSLHLGSNPARREPHLRALALERALKGIYGRHPAYGFVGGSLEEKKGAALRWLRGELVSRRPDLAGEAADHA